MREHRQREHEIGLDTLEYAGNGSGVLVRDTKDRDGGTLSSEPAAWAVFVARTKIR